MFSDCNIHEHLLFAMKHVPVLFSSAMGTAIITKRMASNWRSVQNHKHQKCLTLQQFQINQAQESLRYTAESRHVLR
jgi:hypothetical protein